jgi:hypothetical protein
VKDLILPTKAETSNTFEGHTLAQVFHHLFPISANYRIHIREVSEPYLGLLGHVSAAQNGKYIWRYGPNFLTHEVQLPVPIHRKADHVGFGPQEVNGVDRFIAQVDDVQTVSVRFNDGCNALETKRRNESEFL